MDPLPERTRRYVGLMVEGSTQIADLLERLALIARIERGSYAPTRQSLDSLELVRAAAELVGVGEVAVDGAGAAVEVDPAAAEQSLAAFFTCAIRHGDSEQLECDVRGAELAITPVTAGSSAILLGDDLRDFGAVAARIHIEALGGSVSVDGDKLLLRLPT
jgi:hypothetical protein